MATQGAWTDDSEILKMEPLRLSFLLKSIYDVQPTPVRLKRWKQAENNRCILCAGAVSRQKKTSSRGSQLKWFIKDGKKPIKSLKDQIGVLATTNDWTWNRDWYSDKKSITLAWDQISVLWNKTNCDCRTDSTVEGRGRGSQWKKVSKVRWAQRRMWRTSL